MRISFTILNVLICLFLCTACHQEKEKKSSATTSITVIQTPAQQIVTPEEKAKAEKNMRELEEMFKNGEADKEVPYRK